MNTDTDKNYTEKLDIEILICTYNRLPLLKNVIASINQANIPEGVKVGILVVANACNDGTVEYLRDYEALCQQKNEIPIRWLEEKIPGKSHALNTAIPKLSGSVIAFVDDDHRVDENYLSSMNIVSNDYPVATIFCGRILPDWNGNEPSWAHDIGPYAIYPLPVPRYDQGDTPREITIEGPLPGGGNIFLRKEVFGRVGDFSTELGPEGHNLGGGEDSDYVSRALSGGEKIQYDPSVIQYHLVEVERFKLRYLLQKSYQRSRSVTRVKHRSVSWPPKYLWRKLSEYFLHTVTSLYWPETRFYLVRTAATLGEISAYLAKRK